MFRLFRLALFVTLSFLAGMVFETIRAADRCVVAGGQPEAGLCRGVPG